MIKSKAHLEFKKEDRVYDLICDEKGSWGEVHDVLWKMIEFTVNKMVELNEQQKPKPAENPSIPE